MNWSSQSDYKKVIKLRFKELKSLKPELTLKRAAEKIPIQYTYLSRLLNDDHTHLNEDDLFRLGEVLEFLPNEMELLLLMRAHQTATQPSRRKFLFERLDAARKRLGVRAEDREVDSGQLRHEMAYLFDPGCVVLWVAMNIRAYRDNPKLLCPVIGISIQTLREMLKKLEVVDLIALEPGGLKITEVKKSLVHFSKTHPLMRVHQYLVKLTLQDRLLKTPEEEKESFQATFTADESTLFEVRAEFKAFIERVQSITSKKKSHHVYQLAFDFCRWF